ncbi:MULTISPECIES: general stress protein CsbD [Flavobacterium]|uniref:General stress protein CsbD n=2 Tax=Flavobacterium TaxID=237 RepID=A0A4R5D9F5_9FLAO|nr:MULTISPECIES: general stress protein CsbD [Flavobacterium]RBN51331.1 general stress protein CsbD [Flavobacterium psychrolimnae]TDE07175.1 general stress protein CsbD [Flavobacterium sandaracinum]
MDPIEREGNWEEQKKELKEKFAALTNNKALFSEEKKEEMLKKYQAILGISRAELLQIFEGL